jgi:site-specific recombinase XerD
MGLTTSQAVDLFLESLYSRYSTRTIGIYRLIFKQFLKHVPTNLSKVTNEEIRDFLDYRVQCNPALGRMYARTLRALYSWLMQQKMIQSNPME